MLTYIDIQEPQGSQLERMADGSDNPVETISDEDLLDEGRVALELGVGNAQGLDGQDVQDCPLEQSNHEAGCTQGSESTSLVQAASSKHLDFEQYHSLREDLPRGPSEHNCQGPDVGFREPSDYDTFSRLKKDTHKPSRQKHHQVPDDIPVTHPAPPVHPPDCDSPSQNQATRSLSDILPQVPDEISPTHPVPPARTTSSRSEEDTHKPSPQDHREVPDETTVTHTALPVCPPGCDSLSQNQATRTLSDIRLPQVPDETSPTLPVPPARTYNAPPTHEAIHTPSEQGLRQGPDFGLHRRQESDKVCCNIITQSCIKRYALI